MTAESWLDLWCLNDFDQGQAEPEVPEIQPLTAGVRDPADQCPV